MLAFIEFLDSKLELTTATKIQLGNCIEVKYYRPHQFLRQQGDVSNRIFFIRKGLVHMYRNREKTDWLACENEVICPYNRFLLQQPSSVYYETLEPTEVQTIDFAAFQHLLHNTNFKDAINHIVIERLYRVNKFLLEISCSAVGRYQVFMQHFPNLANRVQATILASFLGLSTKTIGRVRSGDKICTGPMVGNTRNTVQGLLP